MSPEEQGEKKIIIIKKKRRGGGGEVFVLRRVICLLLLFIFLHSGEDKQSARSRGAPGPLAGAVAKGQPGRRLRGLARAPPPLPNGKRKDNGKKKEREREKGGKKPKSPTLTSRAVFPETSVINLRKRDIRSVRSQRLRVSWQSLGKI